MTKPERRKNEIPVAYYKRTRCCPVDFMEPFKGKFYCNPAHCDQVFDDEAVRDRHVEMAYSILG